MITEETAFKASLFMIGTITGWAVRGLSDRLKRWKQREQEQNWDENTSNRSGWY